jgi:hypothetical protein
MTKLIKTGEEICTEIELAEYDEKHHKFYPQKYLVLPLGLDVLEEMLKEEFRNSGLDTMSILKINSLFSSVFARFKKEQLEVKER